jgi:hypothetical protein
MILIGMTGKAGSGKDTAADCLVREHGFTKLSFAGPLKAMMAAAGMPEPADRDAKEQPIPGFDFSWRRAAQRLGTEWGRGLDPDIWVKVMAQQIQQRNAVGGIVRIVLSDVRFDNEAAMIRRLGGKVLHVLGRAAVLGEDAGHASEAGVFFDRTQDRHISNSGSLDDLFSEVRYAVWSMA